MAAAQLIGGAAMQGIATEAEPGFCQRLGNSIFCAICCAPILILIGVIVTGYNEKHSVCQMRAVESGRQTVKEVGCSDGTGHDTLVMFSCDLAKNGLTMDSTWQGYDSMQWLLPFKYEGTGLKVDVEMFQCVEHQHSRTSKVGKKTVTTYYYTYNFEWRNSYTNSHWFKDPITFQIQCGGVHNPTWPSHIPANSLAYANEAKVGPYKINNEFIRQIPLETMVDIDLKHMAGWNRDYEGMWSNKAYEVRSSGNSGFPNVGSLRMLIKGNNWGSTRLTVYGHDHDGVISRWHAPPGWLCSGFTLGSLEVGQVSKIELFKKLKDQAQTEQILLRLTGFMLFWIAFCAMAAPLGVVADVVPLIGNKLGGCVACATCCLALVPATAIFCFVAGIIWVVMRPLVGLPLLFVFLSLGLGMVYYVVEIRPQRIQGASTTVAPMDQARLLQNTAESNAQPKDNTQYAA